MVLGMLFENFKNYYILRYVIYEFLKKVLGVPQPTCLVRVFCEMLQWFSINKTEYAKLYFIQIFKKKFKVSRFFFHIGFGCPTFQGPSWARI